MNKHNWTSEEEEYIKSHYQDETYDKMGTALRLSATAVRSKCVELGCLRHYGGNGTVWSAEMLDYLRVHYPIEPVVDISDHLGISDYVVSKKAKELGLQKSSDYDTSKVRFRYVRAYQSERYRNYK